MRLSQQRNPGQRRRYSFKRRYGIDEKRYTEMLNEQDHHCALCGKEESAVKKHDGKVRRFAIDHDHATGKVRALLCTRCNVGLGAFGDDLDLLRKAIVYVEKYSSA